MKQIEIIGYKKTPTTCSIAVALTQEEFASCLTLVDMQLTNKLTRSRTLYHIK